MRIGDPVRRAGYSAVTARPRLAAVKQMLTFRATIARAQAKAAGKAEVTIERVMKNARELLFADIAQAHDEGGNLLPAPKMAEDIRRALAGVEITELYGDG